MTAAKDMKCALIQNLALLSLLALCTSQWELLYEYVGIWYHFIYKLANSPIKG